MGVAGDAEAAEQANAQRGRLAEVMADARTDGDDAAHADFVRISFRRTRA
jgi:hypothetical protein